MSGVLRLLRERIGHERVKSSRESTQARRRRRSRAHRRLAPVPEDMRAQHVDLTPRIAEERRDPPQHLVERALARGAVLLPVHHRRRRLSRTPQSGAIRQRHAGVSLPDRSTLWLSLIHISEPTRQAEISYAVF